MKTETRHVVSLCSVKFCNCEVSVCERGREGKWEGEVSWLHILICTGHRHIGARVGWLSCSG